MSLLEEYKELIKNNAWVEMYTSSSNKNYSKIFEFTSTNNRSVNTLITILDKFKDLNGLSKEDYEQKKYKHVKPLFERLGLLKENDEKYFFTDLGEFVLLIKEKFEKDSNEAWFLASLIYLMYKNKDYSLVSKLNFLIEKLLKIGYKIDDLIKELFNLIILNKKEEILNTDIFWEITFIQDKFLRKFLEATENQRLEFKKFVIESKGEHLNKKIGDNYTIITFHEEIKQILMYILILKNYFDKEKFYLNLLEDYSKYFEITQKEELEFLIEKNTLIFESIKSNIIIPKISKSIQKIYYGAPGTGKSFQVTNLIKIEHGGEVIPEYVFRTTIYPDYSYFNFVGTIMPTVEKEENSEKEIITYKFKPGIFTQALKKALDNPTVNIFLVLEEMSRGNIAAIFGDIFQLLDRDETGRSDYEIKNDLISDVTKLDTVYLPANLHIIGTVNTSDQNVNVIDTAFKRRFDFEYSTVEPVCDKDGKYLNSVNFKIGDNNYEWNQFYTTLNKFIINKLELSEDKQIGQFFIKFNEGMVEKEILPKIQNKLLHYLWEDVQGAALSPNYSIFKSECKRFLDVYKALEIGEEIFSKEFIEMYKGNNKDVDENNVEEESNELDDSE